jgi:hypothetical protein
MTKKGEIKGDSNQSQVYPAGASLFKKQNLKGNRS